MESALVKNRRDLIEVKNGYFIHHLHSTREIAEPIPNPVGKNEYRFKLRPPNDSSFSDKYNQALIRIRKAVLYTPSGFGANQCLFGVVSRSEEPNTIVRLKTSIRSNQISTEVGDHDSLAQFVHNRDNFDNNLSDALYHTPGGGMGQLLPIFPHESELSAIELQGSTAITLIGNTNPLAVEDGAGAGTGGVPKEMATATSVSFRCDNSATSIFETGILVSNPYKGADITFETKFFETAEDCILITPGRLGGTGNAAAHANSLYVQLEVQLLPNPTPSD